MHPILLIIPMAILAVAVKAIQLYVTGKLD